MIWVLFIVVLIPYGRTSQSVVVIASPINVMQKLKVKNEDKMDDILEEEGLKSSKNFYLQFQGQNHHNSSVFLEGFPLTDPSTLRSNLSEYSNNPFNDLPLHSISVSPSRSSIGGSFDMSFDWQEQSQLKMLLGNYHSSMFSYHDVQVDDKENAFGAFVSSSRSGKGKIYHRFYGKDQSDFLKNYNALLHGYLKGKNGLSCKCFYWHYEAIEQLNDNEHYSPWQLLNMKSMLAVGFEQKGEEFEHDFRFSYVDNQRKYLKEKDVLQGKSNFLQYSYTTLVIPDHRIQLQYQCIQDSADIYSHFQHKIEQQFLLWDQWIIKENTLLSLNLGGKIIDDKIYSFKSIECMFDQQILILKVRVGHGLRTPSLSEKLGDGGKYVNQNLNLNPETNQNFSTSLLIPIRNYTLEAKIYRNIGKSFISYDSLDKQYKNINKVFSQGLNLIIRREIFQGFWFVRWNRNVSRNKTTLKDIPYVLQRFLSFNFGKKFNDWGYIIKGKMSWCKDRFNKKQTQQDIGFEVNKNCSSAIKYFLKLNNIFDHGTKQEMARRGIQCLMGIVINFGK